VLDKDLEKGDLEVESIAISSNCLFVIYRVAASISDFVFYRIILVPGYLGPK